MPSPAAHAASWLGDIYRGPAPSEWLSLALEAARLATSAVNRQPWRFVSEGEDVLVEEVVSAWPSGHISRRLDCGIAMLHFELGARRGGRTGTWTLLSEPRVARFEP
ncbi:MAG: nitroreductase family protein [Bacillota bacterium]